VERCAACHGEAGYGDGPRAIQVQEQGGLVPKLADAARQRAAEPADWYRLITDGRLERLMPGFAASLSPQQRWDVVAYVWALGTTTSTLEVGRALYAENCLPCHGAQGKGDGPRAAGVDVPDLTDSTRLADASLLEIADGMAHGDAHRDVKLGDQQRYQAAEYVRALGYAYADAAALREAYKQGDGVLQVRAFNVTLGAPAARGLPVTLRVYGADSEVLSRTAALDDTGVVTFENLPRQPDYFFQPETVYSGAKFYAMPVQFTNTATSVVTGVLPVYEVTTDPGVISVSELHSFVQGVGEGRITLVDFYLFDNSSDRAFVSKPGPGGQPRSLQVSLPPDATHLRFDGPGLGARFIQSGTVIFDTDAVAPGARAASIVMIYDVPYRGSREVELKAFYPVRNWNVLLPEGELRAPGLQDKGVQETQSGNIRLYEPAQPDVPAGGTIAYELVGQPRGAPVPGADARAIGVGLMALAAAVGLSYVLIIRARRARIVDADLAGERQLLLDAIVELDAQHVGGKISDEAYQARRLTLKRELRDIWQ